MAESGEWLAKDSIGTSFGVTSTERDGEEDRSPKGWAFGGGMGGRQWVGLEHILQ